MDDVTQDQDMEMSTDDQETGSPADVDYKELYAKEKERAEKISADYLEKKKEADQFHSTIKNLGGALEQAGIGQMVSAGDKIQIKLNQRQQEQQLSEIDKLNQEANQLKQKRTNDEITDDEYYEKIAEIKAEQKYLERRTKENELSQKEKQEQDQKQYKENWQNKIYKDFSGQASSSDTELFKKMNEIATPGVDYQKDLALYYELAKRAKTILDSGRPTKMNPTDEYGNLTHQSNASFYSQQSQNQSILNEQDRRFIDNNLIEVKTGGEKAAKRIERILAQNKRAGNIRDNDPYFTNSAIHMES